MNNAVYSIVILNIIILFNKMGKAQTELNYKHTKLKNETPSHLNVQVQVLSSRNKVYIEVNSKKVLEFFSKGNETFADKNATNGLHAVALNPITGKTAFRRRFDTSLFAEGIGIPPFLSSLKGREIIIFAVKYDAALNLSKDVRKLFLLIGALAVPNAVYRGYFIWVFINGGKTLVECFVDDNPSALGDFTTAPISVDILIPTDSKNPCWHNAISPKLHRRYEFCIEYGGYGDLCNCDSPMDIDFRPPEIENNAIRNVPILIIASNRPQALFKCLLTLLNQPGGHKENIIVSLDGSHLEANRLLELLEISYVINPTENITFPGKGGRIAYHYRFSLEYALEKYYSSKFIIVLEEDILTSPNFISYFHQTSRILASDPSLYCINAWNDLSAMHTGGNIKSVMRTETLPAYGWMITREFFEQVNKIWFPLRKDFDWDIWFRGPNIRANRECLVPEISRSFHLGDSGVHIKGQMTLAHMMGHLTAAKQEIQIQNLDRLILPEYEEEIYSLLESDDVIFLNTSLHPCHSNFVPKNYTEKTIVIFFWMESTQDSSAWYKLSSCLGIFNMDTRNNHKGLFRFYFYNTRIFAIGYPFSDYSYFKPSFVYPISYIQSEWDEEHLNTFTLMNRMRFRVPEMEILLPFSVPVGKPKGAPIFKIFYNNKQYS